jgi:hypothetical protein
VIYVVTLTGITRWEIHIEDKITSVCYHVLFLLNDDIEPGGPDGSDEPDESDESDESDEPDSGLDIQGSPRIRMPPRISFGRSISRLTIAFIRGHESPHNRFMIVRVGVRVDVRVDVVVDLRVH